MLENMIMQSIFIDPKWVADEYLRCCKADKYNVKGLSQR
jgi:hypothetical protein